VKVIERGAEDAAKGRLRRFGRTSTRDNDHFSPVDKGAGVSRLGAF
jgi:hypothetical protein